MPGASRSRIPLVLLHPETCHQVQSRTPFSFPCFSLTCGELERLFVEPSSLFLIHILMFQNFIYGIHDIP